MKKTLIALAAVAATSAAFAQSSVSLYGRMDLGYSSETNKHSVGSSSESSKNTSFAGAQNNRTSSRLGVTGSEDLGGGLTASFNWEVSLSPDNTDSSQSGFGKTRLANLNLNGSFGQVKLGTFDNAFDDLRSYSAAAAGVAGGSFLEMHADVFNVGGVDSYSSNRKQVFSIPGSVLEVSPPASSGLSRLFLGIDGRSTNAVSYVTPDFNGFKGAVLLGNDVQNGVGTNGAATFKQKTRTTLVSGSYNQGPLSAMVVLGSGSREDSPWLSKPVLNNVGVPTLSLQKTESIRSSGFAVSYDFQVVKPYFVYERNKNTAVSTSRNYAVTPITARVTDVVNTRAYELGASFPMGLFTPYVAFGSGRIRSSEESVPDVLKNQGVGVRTHSPTLKTSSFQLGTTYDLSKRTQVYGAVGQAKVKDTGPVVDTSRKSGYAFGLVHKF